MEREAWLDLVGSGKVLVIGELNVDLVASGLHSLPGFGQEVLANDFRVTLGSASAIFACGLARLGHPVTFLSRVGTDDFGRFCIEALKAAGIATDQILHSTSATGVTVVLSSHEDRALVTCLGAIAELRYEQLPSTVFVGHCHLHLTSYFLQHGLRPDFTAIMRDARRRGLTVSFAPNSDPAQTWEPEIWKVFAEADVVFLNEAEALGVTRETDLRGALDMLGRRTSCAVIKQGKRGATAIRRTNVVHVDGFDVNAVDATGAGDSFAAGFIHGMLRGNELEECMVLGNGVGALSTLQVGGTSGQPDPTTLENFLRTQRKEG